MKKIIGFSFILLASLFLFGCSSIIEEALELNDDPNVEVAFKQDAGDGNLELLTPTISPNDNQLKFTTEGIDEEKVTFIYVANELVFAQTIKNGETYSLDIEGIEDAHRTDYKPKVQLIQTADDTEDGGIVIFKQVRYKVKD